MFDPSAPHIIILLVVVLLLFGSTRLPGAAKALGQSMHIFKKSVKGLEVDDEATPTGAGITQVSALPVTPQPLPSAPAQDATQQQIQELQRQVQDLKRRPAGGDGTVVSGVPLSEAQRDQKSF